MVIKRDIWYTPTQKMRRLHIYLPDSYDYTQERYPVMYFFDGHNLFYDEDATYGTSWGLKGFLDHWNKPMIVVGIECGHEGEERLNEYCPYHVGKGFLSRVQGIGDDTIRWMIDDLKTMIDRDYRTCPFRECTGIAGSSMGGLMALFASIRYNQWFSKAACLSSAISPCMSQLDNEFKCCSISPDTRVYLSWGTREAFGITDHLHQDKTSQMWKRNQLIAKRFSSRGAATQVYCQAGGQHCEADWAKQVQGFMRFLWES
ncbi:MAG: alpha/beta hydrolase [Hungatella sp.]|nr:alpha/beta hydrolase [Hungatella sp.]